VRLDTGCDLALTPDELAAAPARLDDPDGRWLQARMEDDSVMGRLLRVPNDLLAGIVRDAGVGDVPFLPAIVGYAAARDLAALWAWWVGAGGEQRLGRSLRDASLRPQSAGHDHVLERRVSWGLGPALDDDFIGMGGVGGCVAGYDPIHEFAIAFTTPQLSSPERLDPLEAALRELG
jgi:hypothetical protein